MNNFPNFTAEQIKAARKTGPDFPKYAQDLKNLGVLKYDFFVKDGTGIYRGANDYSVTPAPRYEILKIAEEPSIKKLREALRIHQQGQSDFPTFCQQAADAGVERWIVDLENMVCLYFDQRGRQLVSETIPAGARMKRNISI